MTTVHDLDDATEKRLREGYHMLLAGFAASLITILAIWKPFFGLAWIVQWTAGTTGISRSARVIPVNPVIKYASFVLAMGPLWGIPALGWFLLRTHRFLNGEEATPARKKPAAPAPRQRISRPADEPEPAASGSARAAAPAAPAATPASGEGPAAAARPPAQGPGSPPPDAAPAGIAGVLPAIKAAGLSALPEGQRLRAKIRGAGVEMKEQEEPVILTAKGTFALAYVVDEGEHYAWVNQGRLQESGMDAAVMHRTALDNLRRRVNGEGGPGLTLHPIGTAWGMAMGGDHEATLVLLDELWDGPLKRYTPNGAVAAIPARDICAFCDARSADGIAQLKGVVARVTPGGRGLVSDRLFVRRDGNWAPLE